MSTVRVNQIVALNQPKKAAVEDFMGKYYQLMDKKALFNGQERTYKSKDDDGEQFPDDSTKVQFNTQEVLSDVQKAWISMFDVVLTNDHGNSVAKADIEIDGKVLLAQVPVSNLLWLEKQINNWKSVIKALPTLTLQDDWAFDKDNNLYKTKPVQTHKTSKVPEVVVLYQHTDKHPAQTQLLSKDVTVGHWTTIKLSSALPCSRVELLLDRVEKFREAVLKAREKANSTEIEQQKGGEAIIDYIFA